MRVPQSTVVWDHCLKRRNAAYIHSCSFFSGCPGQQDPELCWKPREVLSVPRCRTGRRFVLHRVWQSLLHIFALGAEPAHCSQTKGSLLDNGLSESDLFEGAQRHFNGRGNNWLILIRVHVYLLQFICLSPRKFYWMDLCHHLVNNLPELFCSTSWWAVECSPKNIITFDRSFIYQICQETRVICNVMLCLNLWPIMNTYISGISLLLWRIWESWECSDRCIKWEWCVSSHWSTFSLCMKVIKIMWVFSIVCTMRRTLWSCWLFKQRP